MQSNNRFLNVILNAIIIALSISRDVRAVPTGSFEANPKKIDKPTHTGGVTLVEGLKDWNLIPKSMIGIQLGRSANGADGTGQITLGGSDTSKYKTGPGNLETLSNQDTSGLGLWAMNIADVNVDGKTVSSNRQTILDTGNTQILVSNGDAQLFHNYPGTFKTPDGIFGVPCDHTKIPPMSFKIGSVEFQINPVDIIGMKIGNRGLCYSLIQDTPRARWSLGTPFMKSVYQIFDSDANKITLAKLK
ncbi:hypothetical protein EWM64_g8414 [Hericium alpestre]|uniref:Peptidase A1 domain-containing protein n=1 Tax=Hericium alpestre TaxID=135208 RepID=A0A4Y9ZQ30_9AGAM|nr:hypothetical protein EWM64_g8414 [Hericium alpestre]